MRQGSKRLFGVPALYVRHLSILEFNTLRFLELCEEKKRKEKLLCYAFKRVKFFGIMIISQVNKKLMGHPQMPLGALQGSSDRPQLTTRS